jgi:hypothetical protein
MRAFSVSFEYISDLIAGLNLTPATAMSPNPSELPLRATGHKRLISTQIISQPKRARQVIENQSFTQPQPATANEEANQSSPLQKLQKLKEKRVTVRARRAKAGEI